MPVFNPGWIDGAEEVERIGFCGPFACAGGLPDADRVLIGVVCRAPNAKMRAAAH